MKTKEKVIITLIIFFSITLGIGIGILLKVIKTIVLFEALTLFS